MLKWISNTIDPNSDAFNKEGDTSERRQKAILEWLSGKHIGEPKGNDTYTVEQFKQMNMVGVYTEE